MPTFLRNRLTAVWVALVLATVLSFVLGHDHASVGTAGIVVVILIAFVKVRYVGLEFMELKDAPLVLRLVFEFWCVAAGGMVVALFLIGTA